MIVWVIGHSFLVNKNNQPERNNIRFSMKSCFVHSIVLLYSSKPTNIPFRQLFNQTCDGEKVQTNFENGKDEPLEFFLWGSDSAEVSHKCATRLECLDTSTQSE